MFCDCSCGSVVAAVVDFPAEATATTAVIPSPELATPNGRLELVEAAELDVFGDLVGLLCVVGNANELACSLLFCGTPCWDDHACNVSDGTRKE